MLSRQCCKAMLAFHLGGHAAFDISALVQQAATEYLYLQLIAGTAAIMMFLPLLMLPSTQATLQQSIRPHPTAVPLWWQQRCCKVCCKTAAILASDDILSKAEGCLAQRM